MRKSIKKSDKEAPQLTTAQRHEVRAKLKTIVEDEYPKAREEVLCRCDRGERPPIHFDVSATAHGVTVCKRSSLVFVDMCNDIFTGELYAEHPEFKRRFKDVPASYVHEWRGEVSYEA